jgi:hypothetical protein
MFPFRKKILIFSVSPAEARLNLCKQTKVNKLFIRSSSKNFTSAKCHQTINTKCYTRIASKRYPGTEEYGKRFLERMDSMLNILTVSITKHHNVSIA